MSAAMRRVLLVDDQDLVRSGLRRILRPRDGFEVVAECVDGDQVLDALAEHEVDVLVLDLRMKRVSGIEVLRLLADRPEAPPALVLTTFDDDELLSAALRAGAAGFMLKDSPAEDLIRGVEVVAAGGSWLDPLVTGRVLAAYRDAPRAAATASAEQELLTTREREVLVAVARGRSNSEIAVELVISELTVKSHVGRIFAKLGLRDRSAVIVWAYDHGLVRPGG
ncbi:response regulator transcription factor [Nocardioides dubius]|uniref:response regulator transcription factor n=1 Tax=Nocardioides dubius TaxID=317019 RepID=UPI0031E46EF2